MSHARPGPGLLHRPQAPAPAGAPVLIALPIGAFAGGILTWTRRVSGALAATGRRVLVVSHAEPRGYTPVELDLPPGVESITLRHLPALEACAGHLEPYLPVYRRALDHLQRGSAAPAVLLLGVHAESLGIAASLSGGLADRFRVVGIAHIDAAYDRRMFVHYERLVSRFVGVSAHVAQRLADELPARREHIHPVLSGIDAPAEPPPREPLAGRPLRLVYVGRLDHQQKRVRALAHLARALSRRGIDHHLTLVGEGPARADLERDAAELGVLRHLTFTGPARPADVQHHLDRADLFVLPSRFEGLSLALLEAMSRGCAGVACAGVSGAREAIDDGRSGVLVTLHEHADERDTGEALARGVERAVKLDVRRLGLAAHARVLETFSLERQGRRLGEIIDDAARDGPRTWPADRPCAFAPGATHLSSGSGALPADAPARFAELLESLAGRTIILHGAGAHTCALAPVLARSPARILAVADDDAARRGTRVLGWRVIAPEDAAAAGATDVVISTWMHAGAVWARRYIYERQGVRVHNPYLDAGPAGASVGLPPSGATPSASAAPAGAPGAICFEGPEAPRSAASPAGAGSSARSAEAPGGAAAPRRAAA